MTTVIDHISGLEIRSLQDIINDADPRSRPNYRNWLDIEKQVIERGLATSLDEFYLFRYHQSDASANDLDKELNIRKDTSLKILKKMGFPIKTLSQLKKGKPLSKETIEKIIKKNTLLNDVDKEAFVELISDEIEMYRQGKIKRLTPNYELAEIIDSSGTYISHNIIPSLNEIDRTFRSRVLHSQERQIDPEDIKAFNGLLNEQYELYEKGKIYSLPTHDELKILTGWSVNSIRKYLKEHDQTKSKQRSTACSATKNGKTSIEDRVAMIELIKEELEIARKQEDYNMTENIELAIILGVTKEMITKYISRFLTSEEKFERKRIITSRKSLQRQQALDPELAYQIRSKAGKRNIEVNGNPAKNITKERKKEIGRNRIRDQGLPWKDKTPEEISDICKKSAKTKYERFGTYFPGVTEEELKEIQKDNGKRMGRINGKRTVELHRKNSYHVEGRFYCSSQQEGAVALLLEKYIPSYRIIEKVNFQVNDKNLNNGGIDFLVNEQFLEWHPIILSGNDKKRGDIPISDCPSYFKICHSLDETERKEFQNDFSCVLAMNYYDKRKRDIDNSQYLGYSLVHLKDIGDLYDYLVTSTRNIPEFHEFKKEFTRTINYVKDFKVKPN
ncbi:MAG: hypothetical protein WC867_03175 [Candidatus Pacearchaeota archaeon]|jgi:hypothetical protein